MSESNSDLYKSKLDEQIQQYSNNVLRFFPAQVHHFWMQNYMWNKIENVFGCRRLDHFYCSHLIQRSDEVRILSIGSGDGQLEVSMAKFLLANGCNNFSIHTTEISPIRQRRTMNLVESEGLQDYFDYHIVDLNSEIPDGQFDLIFAHHVLHHIVELERLFNLIDEGLTDRGIFATVDMIGRNGHMRWPEALKIIELAWDFIPDQWKYNFQHRKFHEKYVNHDCSKVGFEGIRSQDVLPLLVECFAIEAFVAGGGFQDVLFDRGYGQSIDINNPRDVSLVRFISDYNELLLETGRVKPTMVFARMRNSKQRGAVDPRFYGNMSPEFAIRRS